jgi:two-component system sensor histidine kinase YesM
MERMFTSDDSILIYFNEGRVALSKKDYISSRLIFNYPQWRSVFRGKRTELYWRNGHVNDVFQSRENSSRVFSVFRLFGDENARIRGIILFNLQEEFFRQVLTNARVSQNGYLALLDSEKSVSFKTTSPQCRLNAAERNLLYQQKNPAG